MDGMAAAGPLARLRVALAHDSFTQWGGAERVVAVLHAVFPQAPIYTIAVNPRVLPAALAGTEFRTSFLQGWPGMPDLHAFKRYLPFLPGAASSLRPRGFDLVLSSSSAFAHGLQAPDACHVAYIHNTMRFAWDFDGYVGAMGWPAPVRSAGRTAAGCLREWDRRAGARPALLVANSTVVAGRIRRRWGREAAVLPPPVDARGIALGRGPRSHFCVLSRLVPYKRVDLAIAAATMAGERLVVVGDGPDLPRLRRMAGPGVTFLGAVDDHTRDDVLAGALALLVPGVEDFGIAPLEANAAGTPVIATAAGGVLDSQVPGVTGLLLRDPTPEAFADAMRRVRSIPWDRAALRRHALGFGPEAFRDGLLRLLEGFLAAGASEAAAAADRV
jgi:glycosyltransferase involved in cell wall biosynthesis